MPDQADKLELFRELREISGLDLDQYVLSAERRELQKAREEGAALLQDMTAGQDAVDASAQRIKEAREEFLENGAEKNIMLRQKIEAGSPSQNESKYPVEAMVDGDSTTRYAGDDRQNTLTVTVELDGTYRIDTLYVQEFLEKNDGYKTRGDETTIEALCGGEWVTLVDKKALKSEPDQDGQSQGTNIFELKEPANADALRYQFKNTDASKRITLYELQASGERIPSVAGVEEPAGITVKEGTAFSELTLPEEVTATLDDGTSRQLPAEWSEEGYDKDTPGEYTLTGTLALGDDILNPQGMTASLTVTVVSSVWERLDAAISSAQSKDPEDYTEESWSAVQEALDAALKVKDAADVDDQAAEEAADALEQAIEGLVRDVDRTRLESSISGLEKRTVIKELEDLVSQAEKLDPSLYTEDSWERGQTALDAARAVLADPDAAQADCDNAQEALEEAMDALEYLPGGAGDEGNTGDGGSGPAQDGSGQQSAVQTGDPVHAAWLLALLGTAFAAAVLAWKKRNG